MPASKKRRTGGTTVRAMRRRRHSGAGAVTVPAGTRRRHTGAGALTVPKGSVKAPPRVAPLTGEAKAALKATMQQIRAQSIPIAASSTPELTVVQTEGGYSYPEVPAVVEQGIPDYYAASRASRGLEALPEGIGRLARKIGRHVANIPDDPDNRGSIEATIAQVLVAAAQEAEKQGDTDTAARLAKIAGRWTAKVVRAGGKPPTIDPDKPLSGFAFDYGFMGDPEQSLPGGLTTRNASIIVGGLAAIYGITTSKAKEDPTKMLHGLACGGIAGIGALLALKALGYQDGA